jgi:hypothetical protein
MSLVFDEYGRPFIIIKDQGSKSRLKGLPALKVCLKVNQCATASISTRWRMVYDLNEKPACALFSVSSNPELPIFAKQAYWRVLLCFCVFAQSLAVPPPPQHTISYSYPLCAAMFGKTFSLLIFALSRNPFFL